MHTHIIKNKYMHIYITHTTSSTRRYKFTKIQTEKGICYSCRPWTFSIGDFPYITCTWNTGMYNLDNSTKYKVTKYNFFLYIIKKRDRESTIRILVFSTSLWSYTHIHDIHDTHLLVDSYYSSIIQIRQNRRRTHHLRNHQTHRLLEWECALQQLVDPQQLPHYCQKRN